MFGHKVLLRSALELSKKEMKHRAINLYFYSNAITRNPSNFKIFDTSFKKINSFGGPVSLSRDSLEIREVQKCLSYISDDKCWNCKKNLELKQFFCASCGALQYPKQNINFFELLGVSQMYDIDLEDLSKKFKNLQMIFHPDKYANKSPQELEISESYSRLLNRAHTTLKNPLTRGLYMLELLKVNTDSGFDVEPDFLMLIMEKNEELECVTSTNALIKFMKGNDDEIEKQILSVSEAFRRNDVDMARHNLMKLNYFINLQNKIKEKLTDLNSPKNLE